MQAGMTLLPWSLWSPRATHTLQRRRPQRSGRQQEQALNLFLLAGVLVWCIGQLSPQTYAPMSSHRTVVARALDQQPRTPPPVFEPEYADVTQESQESSIGGMPF
jgi:hypothetical protein